MTKVGEYILTGFSLPTVSSFKSIENKNDVCRGKGCMKKLRKREFGGEHAMEIVKFKKEKMQSLTKKLPKSYENAKICYICKEKCEDKHAKDKKCRKVRHHCHYTGEHRGATHAICHLKCSVNKDILIIFHSGSKNNLDNLLVKDKILKNTEPFQFQ